MIFNQEDKMNKESRKARKAGAEIFLIPVFLLS
jgi:hypothetical protein